MKIRLKGEIHPELTRLGLRTGDVIENAMIQKSNGAAYFTTYCLGRNECVVYADNYEIVEEVPEPEAPVDADALTLQAYANYVLFG
jgi:hypothetical protein